MGSVLDIVELSQGFMGTAQAASSEKRLHRFFSEFEIDYPESARLVAGLMEIPQPWILSVDLTNWEFGNCSFNILLLGVVHEGVAFPLTWKMLDKKGNSDLAPFAFTVRALRARTVNVGFGGASRR